MGFLGHLFANVVSDGIKDVNKQKLSEKEWQSKSAILQQKENELCSYLKSLGCKFVYIYDTSAIDDGRTNEELKFMEKIKEGVNKYLSLGGDINVLFAYEDLDRKIAVLEYLNEINQVERQHEFLDKYKFDVKKIIEEEKVAAKRFEDSLKAENIKEKDSQVSALLNRDINSLSGLDFENVCQALINKMGFDAQTTKASGDGGIDIIALNKQPFISGKYIVQCKRYSNSVGEPVIRDLYGVVMSERANKGILMTTGYFTKSAISFAEGKPIELIDGEKLNELIIENGLALKEKPSTVYEFNPEPFMGYNYHDYSYAKEQVNNNPSDINNRTKLISSISMSIATRLMWYGKEGYDFNQTDFENIIQLGKKEIKGILSQDHSNNSNKKLKTLYYICSVFDAELAFYSGDFVQATERICQTLTKWKELEEENHIMERLFLLFALFNILKICQCSKDIIDRYCMKYKDLIDYFKKVYNDPSSFNYQSDFIKIVFDPYNSEKFVQTTDFSFDKLIDDWGEVSQTFSGSTIQYQKENDLLLYINKGEKENMIVKKGINNSIDRQRNTVEQIARNYLR